MHALHTISALGTGTVSYSTASKTLSCHVISTGAVKPQPISFPLITGAVKPQPISFPMFTGAVKPPKLSAFM